MWGALKVANMCTLPCTSTKGVQNGHFEGSLGLSLGYFCINTGSCLFIANVADI